VVVVVGIVFLVCLFVCLFGWLVGWLVGWCKVQSPLYSNVLFFLQERSRTG
jgi:hypothetical protein